MVDVGVREEPLARELLIPRSHSPIWPRIRSITGASSITARKCIWLLQWEH